MNPAFEPRRLAPHPQRGFSRARKNEVSEIRISGARQHNLRVDDLKKRGFVRVLLNGEMARLGDLAISPKRKNTIEIVVDPINPAKTDRRRLADTVETALREGHGGRRETDRTNASGGGEAAETAVPASPNSLPRPFPSTAPSACGRPAEAWADESKWTRISSFPPPRARFAGGHRTVGEGQEQTGELKRPIVDAVAATFGIELDQPWNRLRAKHREILLRGIGDRQVEVRYEGRRGSGSFNMPWEGALNTMIRRFKETKSPMMREYCLKYFSEADCSACGGARLRREAVSVYVGGKSILAVAGLSVAEVSAFFAGLELPGSKRVVAAEVLKEIGARLRFLESVGLSYLPLDRPGPSLSGGESQRLRLVSQLGGEPSGILYVLDEPSVGLHGRDNTRLLETVRKLRDRGNSVIVVEHDPGTILAANWVVDLGPGAGEGGGRVVFSGPPHELLRSDTLTGRYLSGRERTPARIEKRRASGILKVIGAAENNLARIDVSVPLGVFTAVTGVSGAGKSSLVLGILQPALSALLHRAKQKPGRFDRLEGAEQLAQVIHVDQSPIGKTPRSNPATYTGVFDRIRDIFSSLPESRMFGFRPARFSFNVAWGRCEACNGDGVKRVPTHFLPDVWRPREVCGGKRYNEATLRVRYRDRSIAEVLDLTVTQALEVSGAYPELRRLLETLRDVGMDYVKLGQPVSTLSGGDGRETGPVELPGIGGGEAGCSGGRGGVHV